MNNPNPTHNADYGRGWRRLFRRKPKHRHEWSYGPRGGGGWGVVRCLACGETDIY